MFRAVHDAVDVVPAQNLLTPQIVGMLHFI